MRKRLTRSDRQAVTEPPASWLQADAAHVVSIFISHVFGRGSRCDSAIFEDPAVLDAHDAARMLRHSFGVGNRMIVRPSACSSLSSARTSSPLLRRERRWARRQESPAGRSPMRALSPPAVAAHRKVPRDDDQCGRPAPVAAITHRRAALVCVSAARHRPTESRHSLLL